MKEYLIYLLGDLTEVHSEIYPNSRFWKDDEYGIVLELRNSGYLLVHWEIWNTFSRFFDLQYHETQQVMKDVLEEHLKLGGITPLPHTTNISFIGRTFKIVGNHTRTDSL